LDTLDAERGFTGTLQQVLRSAKNLLDADVAGLMLVDHAGALRWASASDPMVETHKALGSAHSISVSWCAAGVLPATCQKRCLARRVAPPWGPHQP
jgi:hypothetical protein